MNSEDTEQQPMTPEEVTATIKEIQVERRNGKPVFDINDLRRSAEETRKAWEAKQELMEAKRLQRAREEWLAEQHVGASPDGETFEQ
jgi:hypothetical protein